MEVKPLAWDSSFFGLRIGRADLSSEREGAALMRMKGQLEKEYDLIYVFSAPDVPFSSPSLRLADKKVWYRKTLDGTDPIHPAVREWSSGDTTPELVELALESGRFSRFKTDSRFPAGSFERLYTRWIEQSVAHAIASHVFCYYVDETPRGLVTLDIREDAGDIGLVAVGEKYQHRHIGSALLHHVFRYAFQQGVRTMTVPTQSANRPACLFYEKLGFSLESTVNIWHWWL